MRADNDVVDLECFVSNIDSTEEAIPG